MQQATESLNKLDNIAGDALKAEAGAAAKRELAERCDEAHPPHRSPCRSPGRLAGLMHAQMLT